MAKVFLSYKREDVVLARRLRDVLGEHGFAVWWDEDLHGGDHWASAIDDALTKSGVVLVLWTKSSVDAEWVRHEAAIGKARGILVPVLAEDCAIPGAFSHINAVNLQQWRGDRVSLEIIDLCSTLKRVTRKYILRSILRVGVTLLAILTSAAVGFAGGRECAGHAGSIAPSSSTTFWPVAIPCAPAKRPEVVPDDCQGPPIRRDCFDMYTESNDQKALSELCANQHFDQACWNLGIKYAKGYGGTTDWTEAINWFRLACKFDPDLVGGKHFDSRYKKVCDSVSSAESLQRAFEQDSNQ